MSGFAAPATAGTAPPGGGEGGGQGAEGERSGPRVSVIVGVVLIAATFLVLATLGVTFLLSQLNTPFGSSGEPGEYQVGDCVVQSGSQAQLADCSAPGAFRIVSEVTARDECGDPTQPAIEVAEPTRYYCLVDAGAPAPEPGEDPEGETDGDSDAEAGRDGDSGDETEDSDEQ